MIHMSYLESALPAFLSNRELKPRKVFKRFVFRDFMDRHEMQPSEAFEGGTLRQNGRLVKK